MISGGPHHSIFRCGLVFISRCNKWGLILKQSFDRALLRCYSDTRDINYLDHNDHICVVTLVLELEHARYRHGVTACSAGSRRSQIE